MPIYCTITRFAFRARRIDCVDCGLFSNHAPLGQTTLRVDEYLYSVLEKVEVKVTVSVTVVVLCGMMMKGREKVKPGAGS